MFLNKDFFGAYSYVLKWYGGNKKVVLQNVLKLGPSKFVFFHILYFCLDGVTSLNLWSLIDHWGHPGDYYVQNVHFILGQGFPCMRPWLDRLAVCQISATG